MTYYFRCIKAFESKFKIRVNNYKLLLGYYSYIVSKLVADKNNNNNKL